MRPSVGLQGHWYVGHGRAPEAAHHFTAGLAPSVFIHSDLWEAAGWREILRDGVQVTLDSQHLQNDDAGGCLTPGLVQSLNMLIGVEVPYLLPGTWPYSDWVHFPSASMGRGSLKAPPSAHG